MRKVTILVAVLALFLALFSSGWAGEENPKNTVLQNLKANYPGIRTYQADGDIARVFGKNFGGGSSPMAAAEAFKNEYAGMFGVKSENLKPGGNLVGGLESLPLIYNRDSGRYKFTLVYYSQYSGEIPVFRADLRLLVRNVPGYPLVMAGSALRDLGDFTAPVGASINVALAQNAARSFSPDLNNFSEPELVVWAGIDDQAASPAVAMEIIADNGKYSMADFNKWLLLVDARTGGILYSENMILNTDVGGNVSGMATQGLGADICGPEELTPLPYAWVSIQGGGQAYADTAGNFTITNSGDTDVTVISEIRGQWFRVYNMGGGNSRLTQLVTPPGPANFIHNELNSSELNRAEVNGYVQANVIRDFVLKYSPNYPVIFNQEQFPVNVNLADVCNAYYDYSSINFFRSGGGCPNTAFSTVIHHEYGHHLVSVGGSGQGQYGEGLGDVMGVLITDTSGLAYGFFSNCSQPLRDADNNYQYPCNGEIHDCGMLLSGCVWSTRNELKAIYPETYIEILSPLVVNSIPMHQGDLIAPDITIDILTLDDDDGDIDNGTPHYEQICAGFGAHNMDCPEIILLDFAYPNGLPEMVNLNGGTEVPVDVIPVSGQPQPGSGVLHYNGGSGWTDTTMEETVPNSYVATFPGFPCGTTVKYYFSAQTTDGATVTDPKDAPASYFSSISAADMVTVFTDNFETDQGWTVNDSPGLSSGTWERGVPITNCNRGNPITDGDGSGSCYLTYNSDINNCDSDVDAGSTFLISPAFDMTGMNAIVKYAVWYTNNFGNDPNNDIFKVWISPDSGQTWTLADQIGPVTVSEWLTRSFIVRDILEPTGQVMVRFEASDLGLGSVVEAGVDAFQIVKWECETTGLVDSDKDTGLPTEFALIGCYPNPFNSSVTIQYALPAQSQVTIDIYDLLGRRIGTIVDEVRPAGYHQAIWDAGRNSTGVYFYRIKADNFTDTKKMLFLK